MRLTLCAVLLAALVLPVDTALGEPEDPAPEPAVEDAGAAEVKRLDKAYKEARTAFYKAAAERRAKKEEDPDAELPALVHPDPEYVVKFLEAAKRYAGTEHGTTFLIRAFGLTYRRNQVVAKEILDELLAGSMQSEQLPDVMYKLVLGAHYLGRDTVRTAISRIIDESPHDAVKAAFLYGRGSLVNRSRASSVEERAAAVQDLNRAMELGPGTRYAEVAERMKHELLHLQVGLPAPEIEGRDLEGVAFKLSDYLGKVVVLQFWGDW